MIYLENWKREKDFRIKRMTIKRMTIKRMTIKNMIIKRIYFPDATYSHNENEFKRFIKTFGLSWYESAKKVYVNANNVKLLTGIYISADQNRRIFAFYEGYEKPVTMIVKILGSGGNFLIDLNRL